MTAYALTDTDREKSRSEESKAKARETWALKRAALEDYVLEMWERGIVPLAIATKAEVSVETVAAIIRESGYVIPTRLTTVGGRVSVCQHCGAAV